MHVQPNARRPLNADQQRRIRSVFSAIGDKGELARVAARHMRETPEYEAARRRGEARDWLYRESHSYAEAAYELLLMRLGDLDA